ncbi:MAG: polysaccharide biosynthesis tyrosine autokinase [Planctomycetes bacterium]|nr:polysaccharide biosynthesis tyrosine autokinase [Planctomycetota bacterium]
MTRGHGTSFEDLLSARVRQIRGEGAPGAPPQSASGAAVAEASAAPPAPASPAVGGPPGASLEGTDGQFLTDVTFGTYLKTLGRRRWLFISTFLAVAVIGAIYTYVFTGTTFVAIGQLQRQGGATPDPRAALFGGAGGAALAADAEFIRSPAVGVAATSLLKGWVASRSDLPEEVPAAARFSAVAANMSPLDREAIKQLRGNRLSDLLKVTAQEESSKIQVEVAHASDGLALAVVNAVIYSFQDLRKREAEAGGKDAAQRLRTKKEENQALRRQLSQQVPRLMEERVDPATGRLLVSTRERNDRWEKLEQWRKVVESQESALDITRRRLAELERQFTTGSIVGDIRVPVRDRQLDAMKVKLGLLKDERTQKVTREGLAETSRDVTALDTQIQKQSDEIERRMKDQSGAAPADDTADLSATATDLQNRISGLKAEIEATEPRAKAEREKYEKSAAQLRTAVIDYDRDAKQAEMQNIDLTDGEVAKQQVTQEMAATTMPKEMYRVLRWAVDAERQSNRTVLFGALAFAFVFALATLFFREHLSDEIHSDAIASHLLLLPVSGRLPVFRTYPAGILPFDDRSAPETEIMAIVRENLRVNRATSGTNLITVVSPGRGEGKSFVSTNMALSFAHSGSSTVLVNTDLRGADGAAVIHLLGDAPPKVGLTQYLQGTATAAEVVQKTPFWDLHIVPCGVPGGNPWKLLSSPRLPELLDALSRRYEIVLLDTAGLMAVADFSAFARCAGNIFFLIREGRTTKHAAQQAFHRLRLINKNILGIIYNGTRVPASRYSYYYYSRRK